MAHVSDWRDRKKIAQQNVQIQHQAARIDELETQLASRHLLSETLSMDGLRLAFENEALQRSIKKLTVGKTSDSEEPKKSSAASR